MQRFTIHNQSFRHEKYSNATELSKLISTLKKSNIIYIIDNEYKSYLRLSWL